jgi:hypothetical protein
MFKQKPPLGSLAHHRFLGTPESRLEALRLPSRTGDTLTYPAAYYEHQEALKKEQEKKAA